MGIFEYLGASNWTWWISQFFGILVIASVYITFQSKDKIKILCIMGVANLFATLMHVFIGNWGVAAISLVTAFKSVAFIFTTKRSGTISKAFSATVFWFFSAFAIGAVLVTHFMFDGGHFTDWPILAAQIFANYTQWAKNSHWIRLSSGLFSVLAIGNAIFFLNIMGIVVAVIKLISITVFYIRIQREKKNI